MKKRKTLEELKLDLIEIRAYRDLQNEEFCFDGITKIKNDSKYSEDAYYEIMEDSLQNTIDEIENGAKKRTKSLKVKKH